MNHPSESASSLYSTALRHHRAGNLVEADRLYRRVLQIDPAHADALHGLGIIARRSGQLDRAIELITRAIALRPNAAEFHTNLGNALQDAGRYTESADAHRRAIELNPALAAAHSNLGRSLWSLRRRDECITAMRRALALNPDSAETLTNLGNALRDTGRSDEALQLQRSAVRLQPGIAEAHLNLGNTLALRGELDEAMDSYRRAMDLRPDSPGFHSQLILTLMYHPACTPQQLADELSRWNQRHAEPLRSLIQPHPIRLHSGGRLRIGFLCSFFRTHVCANLLLPVMTHLDRRAFEVICYSTVADQDAVTERFKKLPGLWRDVAALTDDQLAQQVRDDRIDILFDLHLHTSENRLPVFARKPAPIQVTWLGYPGSIGMPAIDYRLTDPLLDPPGENDSFYAEKSLYLPSFWCYGPDGSEPEVGPLPAANGHITFGCLNNFCKINDPVLAVWCKVLQTVPHSQLVILCDPGSHRDRVTEFMASHGIDPARIRFEPRRPRPRYLALYNEIDIALDTFPYTGHTTTLDACWMGVPVVTLAGRSAVSRGGLSILTNVGRPELVAHTPHDYVTKSRDLASELSRLAFYRASLRQKMASSPVAEPRTFCRSFEQALLKMREDVT